MMLRCFDSISYCRIKKFLSFLLPKWIHYGCFWIIGYVIWHISYGCNAPISLVRHWWSGFRNYMNRVSGIWQLTDPTKWHTFRKSPCILYIVAYSAVWLPDTLWYGVEMKRGINGEILLTFLPIFVLLIEIFCIFEYIYIYIYMYIGMYVCMYVYLYIYMHSLTHKCYTLIASITISSVSNNCSSYLKTFNMLPKRPCEKLSMVKAIHYL